MSTIYRDFLERLKEERISRQWTQQQMGYKLRMNQSHYSKAELGNRRFTYYELQCLCELEFDSYFIFTGNRSNSENKDFLMECTFEELLFCINIIYGFIRYYNKHDKHHKLSGIYKRIEYMQHIILQSKYDNTFLFVRRLLNCNQKKMSKIIGVDIKKLRELEKGMSLPDSEIIMRMYELFHIQVFIFLRDKNVLVGEICYLLEQLECNINISIFDYIIDCCIILKKEV